MTNCEILVLVLGPLFLVALILGLVKLRASMGEVDQAEVIDDDGNIRKATQDERESIAWHLGHQRGKHFWQLLIGGIVLITLVWIGLRLSEVLLTE